MKNALIIKTNSKTNSNQSTIFIEDDQINETSQISIEDDKINEKFNIGQSKTIDIINNQFVNQSKSNQSERQSKRKQLNFFTKNSNQSVQFLKRLMILNPEIFNQKKTSIENFIALAKRFRNFHLFSLFHHIRIRSDSMKSKQNYHFNTNKSVNNSIIFFLKIFF